MIAFNPELTLPFGGIGAGYASVGTVAADARVFFARNTTNARVVLSFDASTTHFTLDAGEAFSMDCGSNDILVPQGTVLSVKHAGAAPTSGSLFFNYVSRVR